MHNKIYVIVQNSVCFEDSLQDWLAKYEIGIFDDNTILSAPEGLHLREINSTIGWTFGNRYVACKDGIEVGTWKLSYTTASSDIAFLVSPDFSADA